MPPAAVDDSVVGLRGDFDALRLDARDHHEKLRAELDWLHALHARLTTCAYDIELYMELAEVYSRLAYLDLAAGAAYKALMLVDAAQDEYEDYYETIIENVIEIIGRHSITVRLERAKQFPNVLERLQSKNKGLENQTRAQPEVDTEEAMAWITGWYSKSLYVIIAQNLRLCGSLQTASKYIDMALRISPDDKSLKELPTTISNSVTAQDTARADDKPELRDMPDRGMVRREVYPWNRHEVDRCSDDVLHELNAHMASVAPQLEVRATRLPTLAETAGNATTNLQLGVFAKEDIAPGELVLTERSLLTANNRLQDALCDACSADLPNETTMAHGSTSVVSCDECETVFCSQRCYDLATEFYHPALCGKDVEAMAKDVPPAEAADALYALLLLRSIALAETQQVHPLDLKEVRYIWGDFHTQDVDKTWRESGSSPSQNHFPCTLPFSFQHNISLPFTMLEKMEINIFENPRYDVWVFNTLYAKFRGTASARLSGLGGRPVRGPEVSAVHPLWCLANHSCDPNVGWEWGGEMRFWARKQRVQWHREEEIQKVEPRSRHATTPGLKKGEEVLNHYCDVELPVKERREWAVGALGGDCRCKRCVWEAGEV